MRYLSSVWYVICGISHPYGDEAVAGVVDVRCLARQRLLGRYPVRLLGGQREEVQHSDVFRHFSFGGTEAPHMSAHP